MQKRLRVFKTSLRRKFERVSFPFMEKLIRKHSTVGDRTFFDNALFPWVAELENNWMDIHEELEEVMKTVEIPALQQVSPDQISLTQDNNWKTYMFYVFGFKRTENCSRCPKTTALLQKIPAMKTAMFSILSPGKHIPSHRGPYNGVLRFHLGLCIPKESKSCRILVGNGYRTWEQGKGLIFDDTYIHEVWNDSNEIRVVLFVDFLRPLPLPYDILNKLYMKFIGTGRFVQDAVGNLDKIAGKNKKQKVEI